MFSSQDHFELQSPKRVLPSVRVVLYADEIKPFTNRIGQRWMYIGLIAIKEVEFVSLLSALRSLRSLYGYQGELHFTTLTTRQKANTANAWLREVMEDQKRRLHFYVLGLRVDYLHQSAFGSDARLQARRLYNRFFRSAVSYVLQSFFGREHEVVVGSIFHDESEMKQDRLFDWHTIWRVADEYKNVTFENPRIEFIDSDHRKELTYPDHSHFIQLTDLVLGATKQCLDLTSKAQYKLEVANKFVPMVERLCDDNRRRNVNSRFSHVGRCSVSFFPRNRLTLEELNDPWKRVKAGFFCNRRLLIKEEFSTQERLFS